MTVRRPMRSRSSSSLRAAMAVLLLAVVPTAAAGGQTSTVVGMVRDSARVGIAGAEIGVTRLHLATRSDDTGRFVLRDVPIGKVDVSVRRLGFEPMTFELTVPSGRGDTLALVLDVKPLGLGAMIVSEVELKHAFALEEFYRRRVRGGGWFVTRADIEARNSGYLSDVLRGMAGLQIVRLARNSGYTIRFSASRSSRRDCPPLFWVDGQRVDNIDLDDFPPRDVEGIELYQGASTTPAQFAQGSGIRSCGTVVLWTRIPED
jgi:hypothetical protein